VSDEPDPYEILEVHPGASEDVIRAAYRTLARRFHPDASIGDASASQMVIVNWAWEILGNPPRRLRYDREHGIAPRPPGAAGGVQPPPTWSATGGARGAGGSSGAPGAPNGTGAPAAGVPDPGASPAPPAFGDGRPPVQRRGADGRVIEWRNAPDGTGAAGEPPGPQSGSILPFGRFIAWSIGEIARFDPGYLDWLDQRREGAPYHEEIDTVLKRVGWRHEPARDRTSRWGR